MKWIIALNKVFLLLRLRTKKNIFRGEWTCCCCESNWRVRIYIEKKTQHMIWVSTPMTPIKYASFHVNYAWLWTNYQQQFVNILMFLLQGNKPRRLRQFPSWLFLFHLRTKNRSNVRLVYFHTALTGENNKFGKILLSNRSTQTKTNKLQLKAKMITNIMSFKWWRLDVDLSPLFVFALE